MFMSMSNSRITSKKRRLTCLRINGLAVGQNVEDIYEMNTYVRTKNVGQTNLAQQFGIHKLQRCPVLEIHLQNRMSMGWADNYQPNFNNRNKEISSHFKVNDIIHTLVVETQLGEIRFVWLGLFFDCKQS